MTGQVSPHKAGKHGVEALRRVPRIVHAFILIWAVFVIVENIQIILWYWPAETAFSCGTIGGSVDDIVGEGYITMHIQPGGVLAKAGVAAGDRVKFDARYDFVRHLRAGERVGLTFVHAGKSKHVTAVAAARQLEAPTETDWLGALYTVATAIGSLFGLFIILRSGRNQTTWLLGTALLTYGLVNIAPQILISNTLAFGLVTALGTINLVSTSVLFYAFAVSFYRDSVGPGKSYERFVFWTYAFVVALFWVLQSCSPRRSLGTPR